MKSEGEVRARLEELNRKWKKHLEDDGGSCYCLASKYSCIPEKIDELRWVLGDRGGCK